MKRIYVILCSLVMTFSLVSCGEDDEENKYKGSGSGMMYNVSLLNNPKSLDPQYADDEASLNVITNLYSGLLQLDNNGNIECCNAESYDISKDGLTYTFKLRNDNFWFFDTSDDDYIDDDELIPVTAYDYEFALKRILDPQMRSPYAEMFKCIKGGTASLNGSGSSIGVTASDDHTLIIELEYASADFLTLMTTPAAYPCNEEFFISTKGRYGLDDDSVMSNGAFFVRQWFYDPYGNNNILYMKANTANSTDDNEICPSFLSYTIERSSSDIRNMFKDAKIDCFTTLNKNSFEKKKYNIDAKSSITLGIVFNDEVTVCTNRNFRRALAYAIDRETINEQTNDDVFPAYGIIPPAVTLLGRSYRDLYNDENFNCFDSEKAIEYIDKAKKEMNAESFGTLKILMNTESVDSAYVHVLARELQEILGFYVSVEEVTASDFYDRIESGDFQIALYPLKAKYNSGISVIDQLALFKYAQINGDTKKELNKIHSCANSADLVKKFSNAEKVILEEYNFIPIFYKNSYLIAESENADLLFDPFSGAVNFRIAKHYD